MARQLHKGPTAVWLAAFLAASANAAPFLSQGGLVKDIDAALKGVSGDIKDLFQCGTVPPQNASRCKVYPGDADWPSDLKWAALNKAVDGRLISKPDPLASVCYDGPLYNYSKCADLTANWNISYAHFNDPIDMMHPTVQGMTCLPPTVFDTGNCTRGAFPLHVINATEPKHVQLGVNFARNTGVRLVVKNTGHDFLGKSGGKDALSIWTHHFKSIEYIEKYVDEKTGYDGPAFKAGVGVQAFEIYKAAHELNHSVVGGEGETVGIFGGYTQGGGHSPLTSMYGLGADQVLAFEVVTADGEFVVANSTSNTELFWAMRGGGGGTFGIATSVTVRAHPNFPTTAARFSFTSEKVGNESFWAGVRAYLGQHVTNADAGTYAYWTIIPNNNTGIFTFNMSPFFAPNKTLEETKDLLSPWLDRLTDLGITFDPNITAFPTVYEAWRSSFPLETVGKINSTTGSRLFGRDNFATPEKIDELAHHLRLSSENNRVQVHFNIKADAPPHSIDSAVNPAWRPNILFAQQSVRWNAHGTPEERLKVRQDFQKSDMQRWRDITPGGGTYLAEADRLEPDFGQAFWGDNYPRLKEVKAKLDPYDVFFVSTGAGTEGWKVESVDGLPNENGKLCRVQ